MSPLDHTLYRRYQLTHAVLSQLRFNDENDKPIEFILFLWKNWSRHRRTDLLHCNRFLRRDVAHTVGLTSKEGGFAPSSHVPGRIMQTGLCDMIHMSHNTMLYLINLLHTFNCPGRQDIVHEWTEGIHLSHMTTLMHTLSTAIIVLLVLVFLVKTQYRSHSAVHSNVTSQLLRGNNIVTSEYIHLPVQHSCSLPLRHCEVPSVFASPSNI